MGPHAKPQRRVERKGKDNFTHAVRAVDKSEKTAARRAFDLALKREYAALAEEVRNRARGITNAEDIWRLHDFLTERRDEIREKYDYRYSVLVFVFARLIGEEWITEADLAGLSEDKLAKIRLMLEIGGR